MFEVRDKNGIYDTAIGELWVRCGGKEEAERICQLFKRAYSAGCTDESMRMAKILPDTGGNAWAQGYRAAGRDAVRKAGLRFP